MTGASRGIGRATARALAAVGARVVLGGRDAAQLRLVAEEIRSRGGEALARPGDLREPRVAADLVQAALDAFGALDIAVHNAGTGHFGPVGAGRTEHWRDMLETNVLALLVGCREALAAMRDRGGHLVNVSSLSGSRFQPGEAVYAATKHAVNAITEVLRLEVAGSGIAVVRVDLGPVLTSFGRNLTVEQRRAQALVLGLDPALPLPAVGVPFPDELLERIRAACPGRFLSAEIVAGAIVDAVGLPPERTPARLTLVPPGTPPDAAGAVDTPAG